MRESGVLVHLGGCVSGNSSGHSGSGSGGGGGGGRQQRRRRRRRAAAASAAAAAAAAEAAAGVIDAHLYVLSVFGVLAWGVKPIALALKEKL